MTLLEAHNKGQVILSQQGKVKYNAVDHPDYKRGLNTHKERQFQRIYSVHRIDKQGMTYCESLDMWQRMCFDVLNAATLKPYTKT